jgi:putative aminopeptidase FrvX
LWKAGADVRVALIGPGTDGTHGYERTHLDALVATTQLIIAYLLDE